MRVLLVEDEPLISDDISAALRDAGFIVDLARDGEDAWFKGDTESYDAIILDLGLPRMDGLSVLKRWRAAGLVTPILILSARGSWMERVDGIEAGADDYLPKPFEMAELIVRLRALIRRAAGMAQPVLQAGDLMVDTRRMTIAYAGQPVRVTPLEFRLVDYLVHNMNRTVSAGELAEHLHGMEDTGDTNAIEAIVSRLRRKLGPGVINTRRGFGYVIEADA
ncbi:DNA-binding response regulator [Hyphomonas polymorpha PS728]|uniref:DNA-binding response regulator n=1 Tax=Hyphomonas polymorpha PS728 TaxID=1280954 RepID=A0A062VEN0_9PROT|nr:MULTISPECIES: response regulator transcription factor [Hyphomonas]AXE64544.1 DNA-binding response regulator [Hyphomonas sp. CACIAM 19H1]KCZ98806.1 DNA-binding response regulator [Hyphomonas polymorpha PS728]